MAKKPTGRPPKYNAKIHDNLVYQLVRDNKTNDDIAENYFDITSSTFYEWLNTHKSFSEAYKKGLKAKLDKVEANMYKRSEGFTYKEITKTIIKGKNGEDIGKAEIKEVTKYMPPDVGAGCFILKTQRRDKWGEKHYINVETQEKDPLTESLEKLSNEEEK